MMLMTHINNNMLIRAFLFILLLSIIGCTPGGGPVNKSISNYFHYNSDHSEVIYSAGGDCYSAGCAALEGVDVKSFRPIGPLYAVDNRQVYYRRYIIPAEVPTSFKYLGGSYSVGSKGVYFDGVIFSVPDPISFSVIAFTNGKDIDYYGVDRKSIYCRDKVLTSDVKSFRRVKDYYFADMQRLYYINDGVCKSIQADPMSFRFINKKDGALSVYGSDSNNVFFTLHDAVIMPDADVQSFKVLCTGLGPPHFAIDKNHVYNMGKRIDNAHPGTYIFPDNCQ